MLNNKTIAVVVPAYNEEGQIGTVIETMPDFVDRIVVVNDCSTDATEEVVKKYIKNSKYNTTQIKTKLEKVRPNKFNRAEVVLEEMFEKEKELFASSTLVNKNYQQSRIVLISHLENITGMSVGAAIATGYEWCRDHKMDVIGLMGSDCQMDPDELESICMPVVCNEADYVKGNRLSHGSADLIVPKVRFLGNSILSLLTKVASGYWHISDTQTGYTAISLRALHAMKLHKIYWSYGCPNDILIKLNILSFPIKEVDIKPVYDVGEKSNLKVLKVIPKISILLFKGFWTRLYSKYLFRDFHPLFLLYHMAFLLLIFDIPFLIQVLKSLAPDVNLPMQSLLIFIFLTITGFQSLFFAMWMDMMDNERLQV